MYGRPRDMVTVLSCRTRGIMLKYRTCQAHRDAFFYGVYRRKGSSVSKSCEFRVGRRLAGGRQGEYPNVGPTVYSLEIEVQAEELGLNAATVYSLEIEVQAGDQKCAARRIALQ